MNVRIAYACTVAMSEASAEHRKFTMIKFKQDRLYVYWEQFQCWIER